MSSFIWCAAIAALSVLPFAATAQNMGWVKLVTSANGEYTRYSDASLDAMMSWNIKRTGRP